MLPVILSTDLVLLMTKFTCSSIPIFKFTCSSIPVFKCIKTATRVQKSLVINVLSANLIVKILRQTVQFFQKQFTYCKCHWIIYRILTPSYPLVGYIAPLRTATSVPHGSVLGLLLLILYTAPLSNLISSSAVGHHLYADDI